MDEIYIINRIINWLSWITKIWSFVPRTHYDLTRARNKFRTLLKSRHSSVLHILVIHSFQLVILYCFLLFNCFFTSYCNIYIFYFFFIIFVFSLVPYSVFFLSSLFVIIIIIIQRSSIAGVNARYEWSPIVCWNAR